MDITNITLLFHLEISKHFAICQEHLSCREASLASKAWFTCWETAVVRNYIQAKSLCTKLKHVTTSVQGHLQDMYFHTEGKASQQQINIGIKEHIQSHIQIYVLF